MSYAATAAAAPLTLTVHQCNVARAGLMVEESADLRPPGILVAPLYQELFGDLLVGDDDELLADHACAVDRAMYVGPFLELLPHLEPI
ncbi:hypothetical protein O1611_g4445 [Lasiodiplodia mahajangana]|uniref:Uncharacterized protein n=1 Tax=Lasiodiplodia mahajangana TaxID=1108764 RepID=A0ACC2JPR5_9PEZI|nr:hypothetical protein O1611_g4445 [Lasiodiplodia mahajangana]